MMNKQTIFTIAVFLLATSLPLAATADDFDGSMPLTCASIYSAECNAADQACITGAPWTINFPVFIEIDFDAKMASTTKLHEVPRKSPISSVNKLKNGHLSLQGIDADYAWSMLIAQETGSMTLSLSAEDTGYLIFGACHPN
jgi:hypothetical protein